MRIRVDDLGRFPRAPEEFSRTLGIGIPKNVCGPRLDARASRLIFEAFGLVSESADERNRDCALLRGLDVGVFGAAGVVVGLAFLGWAKAVGTNRARQRHAIAAKGRRIEHSCRSEMRMEVTGRFHARAAGRFQNIHRLHDLFTEFFCAICGICGLDGNHFELGIHFLLQHALNRHQRAGEGTGTTSTRTLVTNAQGVFASPMISR